MHNVGVGEGARHLANGVGLANVRKELVTQALTLRRTTHNTRDINERNGRGNNALRTEDLGELVQTCIGKRNDTHIRFDGCEGIVRSQNGRAGQSIKQSGLANVGQAGDTNS